LLSRKKYETDLYSNLYTAEARGEIKGELREREKWQGVVADMKAEMTNKEAAIINKEAEIEQLRKQIAELESKS